MPALVPPVVIAGTWGDAPQPEITLDDMLLRPWADHDVEFLRSAYRDPEIQRWHARSMSIVEAREWVGERTFQWKNECGADWAIAVPAGRVGRIGFRTLALAEGRAEVAYWVAPDQRGAGFAQRALRLLTEWAFETGGLHRIELHHSTRNPASCTVAARCGFALEGTAVSSVLHADGWHDMHVHARTC